jgi:3-isopropylmalate/(R)-2-methylmalate dehydratase large subunit
MGGKTVFDPDRILMVLDHYVPCPNADVAALHDQMRRFRDRGFCRLLELGEGICHQLLPEKGYVQPGDLIIGGDSHSTTYGAFNALGTGVGSSDLAAAMITGKLWFRVPEAIKVSLSGCLSPLVAAKDLALHLVGLLGADGASYLAIEFDGVQSLTIADRMTVCNLMVETGAKCAIMPADDELRAFYDHPVQLVQADPDADYSRVLEVDLSKLEPLVALPHQVDNVVPLPEVAGTPVQMGVLGTCTNGRLEDFRLALQVMQDRSLVDGFELLVVPASRSIYLQAVRAGLIEQFLLKGATILPPGCGPCCGSSPGIPSAGENVLSTANRNFLGRMGNVKSNIYLGSPAAVAAAAVNGCITDPREVAE